jgi:ATP-binding cassette subfamily C (CFTR/MRP) protein 10
MRAKDLRIALIKDVLHGIRQIKLMGWVENFASRILKHRKTEFYWIAVTKMLDAFCVFFWAFTSLAISTITFIVYYNSNNDKDLNVFTAIYLFNLLIHPLNALPWTIGGLMTSDVSFKRIDQFLKLPAYREIAEDSQLQTGQVRVDAGAHFFWPHLRPEG